MEAYLLVTLPPRPDNGSSKLNYVWSFNVKITSAFVFAILWPLVLSAQNSKAWTPPKTPWGDPDLQGTWPGNVGVPMQRSQNLGERTTLFQRSNRRPRRLLQ